MKLLRRMPMFLKLHESLVLGLSMGFFGFSLCLLMVVLYDGSQTRLQKNPPSPTSQPKVPSAQMRAKSIDIMELPHTPWIRLGGGNYQILGLGQNPDTGHQVVWVRSIPSNRVGGFAKGQPLFGGPVKVKAIQRDRLEVSYRDQTHEVPLAD